MRFRSYWFRDAAWYRWNWYEAACEAAREGRHFCSLVYRGVVL